MKLRKMSFYFLLIPAVSGVGFPEVATAVTAIPDLGSDVIRQFWEAVGGWPGQRGFLR